MRSHSIADLAPVHGAALHVAVLSLVVRAAGGRHRAALRHELQQCRVQYRRCCRTPYRAAAAGGATPRPTPPPPSGSPSPPALAAGSLRPPTAATTSSGPRWTRLRVRFSRTNICYSSKFDYFTFYVFRQIRY